MEKAPKTETKETHEKGVNVLVHIDLIRHPEKNPETGKLTEKGKKEFFDNLMKDFQEGDEYDTIKFYVSPLPRGQEARGPASSFLEAVDIPTTIRDKKELAALVQKIEPALIAEITKILEERGELSAKELEEMKKGSKALPYYEPPTKSFETKANELTIHEFFDKKFPGGSFTGEDIAEEIKRLVDHFSKLASRLNADSRVRLVLVGHSGIIEHFTKYVYLQNHPELKPKDVDAEMIGGLVGFGEGPEITIQSDENGKQKIDFRFKDLDLTYLSP